MYMYVCVYILTLFWIPITAFGVEVETYYCNAKTNVSRGVWRFLRDISLEFQVLAETVISYIQLGQLSNLSVS
jgi:hypothetical protein